MKMIEFAYMTHPGKIRKRNEDNLVCIQGYLPLEHDRMNGLVAGTVLLSSPVLFGVFDGMGGEERGDVASYLAAQTAAIQRPVTAEDLNTVCDEMNRNICDYVEKQHIRSSGTTASLLLFDQEKMISCHLGDSRIYRFREGLLMQITKDDVWPVYQGKKAPLVQFLGIPETEMSIKPHIEQNLIHTDDIYVICTDGLSDMVELDRIKKILAEESNISSKTQKLMDSALSQGGSDNITIILNRVIGR